MEDDPSATSGNVSQNIKYYENKLNKKLAEYAMIKSDVYMDMFYYIIIVGIMSFFVYVILHDLYLVVKLHSIQDKDSKSSQSKYNLFEDNYEYDSTNEKALNSSMYILQSLDLNNANIQKEFDKLSTFKNENRLDSTIYNNSSVQNISSKFDDYTYPKKKESNFFLSMFEKPKYKPIVNNSRGTGFIDI